MNKVAYFFPPNVTEAVQTMDQNPIKLTKFTYRSMFHTQLVAEDGKLNNRLKYLNTYRCINL